MSYKANDIVTEDLENYVVEKLYTEHYKTLDDLDVDSEGIYYLSESENGDPSDVGYNFSTKTVYLEQELADLIISLKLI
jgi:hypothetical protein